MPVSIIFQSSAPTVCLLAVTIDTRFLACHLGLCHAGIPRWLMALPDPRVLGMTSISKDEAPLWLSDIKEVVVIPEECNDNVVKVTKQSTERLPVWRDLLLNPTLFVRHMLICMLGSTSSNKHVASTPSSSTAPLQLSDIKEVAGIPEECNDDVVKLTNRISSST